MIERDVRDNPVKPGVETAFKSEAVEIPVNPQETFLVNIPRIFAAMNQVQCQTQYFAVIAPHELLERQTVSRLRVPNERVIVRNLHRCVARISLECDAHPHDESHRLRLTDNAILLAFYDSQLPRVLTFLPAPTNLDVPAISE